MLEVGSRDVNGSLRDILAGSASEYIGVDLFDGPGVDVVCDVETLKSTFAAQSFDMVISTEMLEHCQHWQEALYQMASVLRQDGLLLITTRSPGFELHDYPADHWRFTYNNFEVIFEQLGDIIAIQSDMTLGWACGIGILVRKKLDQSQMSKWRTWLDTITVYSMSNALPTSPSEVTAKSDVMIFDQYSRYKACSDLLRQAGFAAGNSVLDIGSGPECLFGQFLPGAAMNYVDPLIPLDHGQGYIANSIFASDLDAQKFDFVSAIDVLEHVPPEDRQAFLERMASLGQNILIIAFPTSDSSDALETDKAINEQYRAIFGTDYFWLAEHSRYGLPSLDQTVAQLNEWGWHCQTIGHGHTPWLRELLGFVICVWDVPNLKIIVRQLSETFNRDLYSCDFRAPCYRQFIVASRNPLPPITLPVGSSNSIAAEDVFRSLMNNATREYFSASMQQLVRAKRILADRDAARFELDRFLVEQSSSKTALEATLAKLDAAQTERDAALAERNEAKTALEDTLAEFEAALAQRAAAQTERDFALAERNNAKTALEATLAEREVALAHRDAVQTERDAALAERNEAKTALEDTLAEYEAALAQRDAAQTEKNSARAERNAAQMALDAALAEREAMALHLDFLKKSRSWRLTRPLRFSFRLARHGIIPEDIHGLSQRTRLLYHRLPLPANLKKAIVASYRYLSRPRWRRSTSLPPSIETITTELALPNEISPNYIIWGVIDWHFRHQRPQQLALALANTGRRVLYISPNFSDNEHEGFDAEPLDTAGLVFQIKLYVKKPPVIYSTAPDNWVIDELRKNIGKVLNWANCNKIISLIQHPFWHPVAKVLPNSRLVYDCMDHHEGFGNNGDDLLQLEKLLLNDAELTITTSSWLDEAIAPYAKRRGLIRNACDFDHFTNAPDRIYHDAKGRRVIGYYGAIAEWFDLNLVEKVAKQHPDCSVLLIGADTVHAKDTIGKLPNVTFTGEAPYSQLPYYLHGFDVCLLPFQVIPLTLATNPVKLYEYLSAGKPVVAVDLPEMSQFGEVIYTADTHDHFLATVRQVLETAEPQHLIQQRKIFASGQTWAHRGEALIQLAESNNYDPKVSVIVITYNNLEMTRACLDSLDKHSHYENLEIIIVDNASMDGSREFLSEWAASYDRRKLILNENNKGFAAANNQGLAIANGDYLVLLNNDTYVTPGWARTLLQHLRRDQSIGLIGPVTNNIGNEAKIDIDYADMEEMIINSCHYTRRHIGQVYPLRTAAFFCVMMARATYERIGPLDESFGRGFFEDDDYCRRIEQENLRVVCAEDVFVHHHLSASFDKLNHQDRIKLFEENKRIYEGKWGRWVPHRYRNIQHNRTEHYQTT